MRRHLIYCPDRTGKRNIGALIDVPAEWSSDDYGAVQEAFVSLHGQPNPAHVMDRYADMIAIWEHDRTANGVYYDWGLSGPGGASFLMLRLPDVSLEQLNEAVREIRRQRDVVSLRTLTIHELVEFDSTPYAGQVTT